VHCYSSSGVNLPLADELTTTEAKQLLSQLVDVNCPAVLFSGGEPLLRSDLFELLAEAKRLGLRTVISSNGTLIDSKTAAKLSNVGVSYVGISIDGSEEFHDTFRQTRGSFKAALSGIENCKKAGLKTGMRFTITKQNAAQIPAVFDISASNGIRRICFYHLISAGRAKEIMDSKQRIANSEKTTYAIRFTLNAAQMREVVDTIIAKTDQFARKALIDEVLTVGNHADGPFLLVKMQKEKNANFNKAKELLLANGGNRIGEKIACVSWDGSVHPDQFWRNYPLGNIKDKTFRQIWENGSEPVLRRLRDKSKFCAPRCRYCKWFVFCKGNFRFLGAETDDKYWLNEPACYLADEEITEVKILNAKL
jgi:radical SAM protein with 4Fe4S-binding SPASM domain